MSERVPVSAKLRFEVFKRDKFTCQYCGAKAPDVVLHADHIDPVAEGGGTEFLNLITSCQQCNGGKGPRRLSDTAVMDKQRDMLAELEERRQQIDMMLQWRNELDTLAADTSRLVEERILTKTGWTLSDSGKNDVRKWIKKYDFASLLRAIDEAFDVYGLYKDDAMTDGSFNKAFKKVPGVMTIIQQEAAKPHLRQMLYIQGIIRKRTGWRRYDCIDFLEHLVDCGFDIDDIEIRAKRVHTIEDFVDPYHAALEEMGREF